MFPESCVNAQDDRTINYTGTNRQVCRPDGVLLAITIGDGSYLDWEQA